MFSFSEIIDIAVQLEKNGETFYRQAAESHSDAKLISLLQWLADDEVSHVQKFSAMKRTLKVEVADPSLAEMGQRLFRQTVGDQGFSLTENGLSSLEDPKGLLDLAIEFEKDTIIFYQLLRSFVKDPDVREQLDGIISEEQSHVRNLQALLLDEAP